MKASHLQVYKELLKKGYTGSFQEFLWIYRDFLKMVEAYNEWFKNPQLGLGQKNYLWGPIGNVIFIFTFGKYGSSCVGYAIGLMKVLEPLNTDKLRAYEKQIVYGIHTNVGIQVKDPLLEKWITFEIFDPYRRLW